MNKTHKIEVEGEVITVVNRHNEDYVSLTDMAKFKNAQATGLVISHWLSTRLQLNFYAFGSKSTTQILILRNSVTLDLTQAVTVLFCRQNNG